MSEIKVNSIKGVGASAAAITVNNTDGTCTANITNNLSNRNLILNGAFQIAQRSTSSTTNGYGSVDRWKLDSSNITHNSTKSQQSLSSSDTPYTLGFRKFARIALSQAGVVATNSYVEFQQKIEAQNISNSGWNYTSSSSFITVQFWFRCSTNQTFYAWVTSTDGTNKRFTFSFTASGNNAWTKITKTIPGASGIQIDDNNEEGFNFVIAPFYGTDYTGSVSLDTWVTKNDATHSPDYASTWLTAGASTFDVTGVQLEVGSVATDFEHRSYGQELQLCKRYYEQFEPQLMPLSRYNHSSGNANFFYHFEVEKRAAPSGSSSGTFTSNSGYAGNPTFSQAKTFGIVIGSSNTCGTNNVLYLDSSGSATCKFSAEL